MTHTATASAGGATVDAAGRTHRGLVRPANEDSLWCGTRVFAVADGVGGHPAGDVASALALEPLAALDQRADADDEVAAALAETVRDSNRRVHDDAAANPTRAGMGTTLTAAVVANHRVHLAHVGDSRAYRWRPGGGLERLTTDHTPAEQAVLDGRLSWEEAAAHPQRHVLTRVVGTGPDVDVDVHAPIDFQPGERLLLCTDGLIEATDPDSVAELLEQANDAGVAADALVEAALKGGAPDNVTVVVVTAR